MGLMALMAASRKSCFGFTGGLMLSLQETGVCFPTFGLFSCIIQLLLKLVEVWAGLCNPNPVSSVVGKSEEGYLGIR